MKAKFEFDLNDFENGDHETFKLFTQAEDLYFAISGFDNYLRSEIKHNDREELQEIRSRLYDFMEDYGVSLDILS